ncbi:hypothetical protein V6N13_142996 [Hibiscus sabdariffa]|uniref:NTF2 domain-containing protein n=1 Tax=Hibiscus sabdariffa TaxID=183260 RepID=A0ABR2FG11_9ROSI
MGDAKATVSLTPQEAAAVFVDRYYLLLCDSPEEVYKFYRDSSMVSRLGSDDTMTTFTTIEEIQKHLLPSFVCKQCHLLSHDSQLTENQGVFVVITGSFTTNDEEIIKFHQSFILTPMQTVDNYLISNDILKFFDEKERITGHVSTSSSTANLFPEQDFPTTLPIEDVSEAVVSSLTDFGVLSQDNPAAVSSPTQDDVPTIYIKDVSSPTQHDGSTPEEVPVAVSTSNDESNLCIQDVSSAVSGVTQHDESTLDNQDVPKAVQHEVETPNITDIPTLVPQPQQDEPTFCMEDFPAIGSSSTRHVSINHIQKKSFSSMVQILNENDAPFKPGPVRKPMKMVQGWKKSGFEEKKKSLKVEDDGTTIFVGNVARGSKPEQLYQAFKIFGRIKPNGVEIKLDRLCNPYAFIQFQSSASTKAAIQASFIKVGDRRLTIKEKNHRY